MTSRYGPSNDASFSVIIPTRARPALLARALASVVGQVRPANEIIVVDDGDGEAAATVGRFSENPVTVLVTGGRGQVPARNLGIHHARSRWIAFLDDDDWWADANHLGDLAAVLTEPGLAYASGFVVEEGGGKAGAMMPFPAGITPQSIRRDNTLLVSGLAYDRALHERLGLFDETMPYYWDWDWYLRLTDAGLPFFPSDNDGVRISIRPDTVSAKANEGKRRADLARLIAKHGLEGVALKNHASIASEAGAT